MIQNYTLENKIWPAVIIQCSYCLAIKHFEDSPTPETISHFAKELKESGWTINQHGAVKCPPCNWKAEEERKLVEAKIKCDSLEL